MRTRRRPYSNQQLGYGAEPEMSEADRIRAYNQAAANQSIAIEQARRQSVADDHAAAGAAYSERQQSRALANALGANVNIPTKETWDEKTQSYVSNNPAAHDTWDEKTQRFIASKRTNPSFDQLKGEFYSRSSEDQAKIFQSGQAPFLGAEEGTKLLQGLAKKREDAETSQINAMGAQLAKGEITFEDRTAYRTVTEPDPTNPLASTKKKVKLTPYEAGILKRGMDRGMLPDIGSPGEYNPAAPTPATPSPSVANPQAARIAAALPADTATRAGSAINQGIASLPGMVDRAATYGINAAAQFPNDATNALKSGVNAITGTMNAVNRFGNAIVGNNNPAQYPAIPYNRIPDETLTDMQLLNTQPARSVGIGAPGIASALTRRNPEYQSYMDDIAPTPSPVEDWMNF